MNNVHVDHLVNVMLLPRDARELLDALLERPHNEEWSNNVAAVLKAALEHFPPAAPPDLRIVS